jgi:hypothetical protein
MEPTYRLLAFLEVYVVNLSFAQRTLTILAPDPDAVSYPVYKSMRE